MEIEQDLVKKFNALPRSKLAPSGMVDNEWHFDLRFISIQPPSHMLFLFQPRSHYRHMENLPVGSMQPGDGLLFFPESGKEAAPQTAKAIMHSFVHQSGVGMFQKDVPPTFAPWTLTTEYSTLGQAVGEELKRIGVVHRDLWTIGTATAKVLKDADTDFRETYAGIKESIGLKDLAAAACELDIGD